MGDEELENDLSVAEVAAPSWIVRMGSP